MPWGGTILNANAGFQDLFAAEQFRISRLQVFNWGTFSDVNSINISEQGFLLVGRSGSGKSTLLDAFSALLVPPRWVDFNAAAREAGKGRRDRSLVSYIRGAWAEQKDDVSGEIATRYLRTGTTWSALALSYQDLQENQVVLVQVFWLRGNANGPADVNRHYLIFQRPFDIKELQEFGQTNLDVRKLKLKFGDAFQTKEFSAYAERFRRLLGIESDKALHLLHKTQSAKNLGDLNTFLRDFMLDRPETFKAAEQLVNDFDELDAAHKAVVTARHQVETLAPAREKHQERESLLEQQSELKNLWDGTDSYSASRRMKLLGGAIRGLKTEAEGLQGEISRRQAAQQQDKDILLDLEIRHRQAGGDQVASLQREKSDLEEKSARCRKKFEQLRCACQELDRAIPETPHAFAELLGKARQELENWESGNSSMRDQRDELVVQKQESERLFRQSAVEVKGLERQASNIPAHMLDLRQEIAESIGVSESALPFVGELLEVKKDEVGWQGAIERVLHGFALSLLVNEQHYSALCGHLNGHHLGQRLVYYRTGEVERRQSRLSGPESLVLKLDIKPCIQSEWLKAELRHRFDYSCVENLPSFRRAERALTREGQVKHSKLRHEKDDRRKVDDRRAWILGFDNREKLILYRKQAQEYADTLAMLGEQIRESEARENSLRTRTLHCQSLVNLQWQEVDLASLLTGIDKLEQRIATALETNTELKEIARKIEQQKKRVQETDNQLGEVKVECRQVKNRIEEYANSLRELENDQDRIDLTSNQQQGLDARMEQLEKSVTLDNLDKLIRRVEQRLREEVDTLTPKLGKCEKFIEKQFDIFTTEWPAEAEGLDASLAAATDFFGKLMRLETDGLPAHEHRFFDLLKNQSNRNLAALSTYLSDARKRIMERMERVNDSLARVPFNRNLDQVSYLKIETADRQLPVVQEFKKEIRKTLYHVFSEDRELAESRFMSLRRLVKRLSSEELEDKRWRQAVLDVRQHMEFIGREFDESGVEVEVYRSGSGKSGGQRQKLTTTCLAAALRYQLGGIEHGVPKYAPVVLDEAFDKADNDFTTLAMNIFKNFGFQMIVATPFKSVMTLEPFIGGAGFVDISDRKESTVLMIEYDSERQRLDLSTKTRREVELEVS